MILGTISLSFDAMMSIESGEAHRDAADFSVESPADELLGGLIGWASGRIRQAARTPPAVALLQREAAEITDRIFQGFGGEQVEARGRRDRPWSR